MNKKSAVLPIVGVAMLVGIVGGSALHITNANAQTKNTIAATQTSDTSTTDNDQQAPQAGQFDPSKGGHTANGKTEEILIGDTAEKVKAAALKAVSGGTIERVETDADGATYEAHMTKADGSHVTVLLDANFNVTSTEEGYGPKK